MIEHDDLRREYRTVGDDEGPCYGEHDWIADGHVRGDVACTRCPASDSADHGDH